MVTKYTQARFLGHTHLLTMMLFACESKKFGSNFHSVTKSGALKKQTGVLVFCQRKRFSFEMYLCRRHIKENVSMVSFGENRHSLQLHVL